MRKAAAILSSVIFVLLVPLSMLAFHFIGWSDGPSRGPSWLDHYYAYMLPGYFAMLAILFFVPINSLMRWIGCVLCTLLYLPVVIGAIQSSKNFEESMVLILLLVGVPVLLCSLGLRDE